MADAAGHSDRLADLVLQAGMVTGVVFLAQETQTVNQFFHALQPLNPSKSYNAAEIRGVLIGMDVVLFDNRELALVVLGDSIQFMSLNR